MMQKCREKVQYDAKKKLQNCYITVLLKKIYIPKCFLNEHPNVPPPSPPFYKLLNIFIASSAPSNPTHLTVILFCTFPTIFTHLHTAFVFLNLKSSFADFFKNVFFSADSFDLYLECSTQ